jgi:hypothetical protein
VADTTAAYYVTTTVGDRVIGEFRQPIPDPLVRTTVTLSWRDLLRGLLRRSLTVEVNVGADSNTATLLLELDPDYLGPPGSASRTAWDASLRTALTTFAKPDLSASGGAS